MPVRTPSPKGAALSAGLSGIISLGRLPLAGAHPAMTILTGFDSSFRALRELLGCGLSALEMKAAFNFWL